MSRWTLIAFGLAIVFFALSISTAVYELTSPYIWTWHIAVRKAYSIVAFSVLGYAARRALDERKVARPAVATIVAVAAYSAAIEVAQFLAGSQEGLKWNAVDVACGAVGGLIGSLAVSVTTRR